MKRRLHGGAMKAARRARDLVAELRIRQPSEIDVLRIAAFKDAHVAFEDLANQQGYLFRNATCGIITVDRRTRESKKWRFVVAHELGHFLQHADRDQFAMCDDVSLHRWYRGSDEEIEANAFAAELLMPATLFESACGVDRPSLSIVSELASEFDTSLTAAALRFIHFAPVPSAVVFSRDGRLEWWDAAPAFPFTFNKGFPVKGTYAADALEGKDVPDGPEEIDAELWSTDTRAERQKLLFENTVRLAGYGALSLLWVPEEETLDSDNDEDSESDDQPWDYHGFKFHRK